MSIYWRIKVPFDAQDTCLAPWFLLTVWIFFSLRASSSPIILLHTSSLCLSEIMNSFWSVACEICKYPHTLPFLGRGREVDLLLPRVISGFDRHGGYLSPCLTPGCRYRLVSVHLNAETHTAVCSVRRRAGVCASRDSTVVLLAA